MAMLAACPGATIIKEDLKGVALVRDATNPGRIEPYLFERFFRDPVYATLQTAGGQGLRFDNGQVAKVVYYLKPDTFPTKFFPEDLDILKAKLEELESVAKESPEAGKLIEPYQKSLQQVYAKESANYQQSLASHREQFATEEEQADFNKKCELMRLDLIANRDSITRSEQIVKEMEGLAPRSKMLSDVLAKWNEEKGRALQFDTEGKQLWDTARKAHPECFAIVKNVRDVPPFPGDLKQKIADFSAKLDQFCGAASFPQVLTYCKAEIPSYPLLSAFTKLAEKIKAGKYEEAAILAQKASVGENTIPDPYKQVWTMFDNYKGLADDLLASFRSQVARTEKAEADADLTDRELLDEYQKAYDMIPDPKIAKKIQALKEKAGSR